MSWLLPALPLLPFSSTFVVVTSKPVFPRPFLEMFAMGLKLPRKFIPRKEISHFPLLLLTRRMQRWEQPSCMVAWIGGGVPCFSSCFAPNQASQTTPMFVASSLFLSQQSCSASIPGAAGHPQCPQGSNAGVEHGGEQSQGCFHPAHL